LLTDAAEPEPATATGRCIVTGAMRGFQQ
jgi:hypothetical protein